MTNLPDYLRDIPSSGIAERALEGLGSSMPPHISIRGNEFTLIDATKNEIQVDTKYLDVNIADVSDVLCKQYFGKEYVDGDDNPPMCWSSNGVGPSSQAMQPQARTCAECKWNVKGSATSKLSGAAIKACRDEKYTAVFPIGENLPAEMLFRLKVTPGSFNNWTAYIERCISNRADISHLVTRLTFEPKKNGVLMFAPQSYINADSAALLKKARAAKATDVLVGRNDRPRTAALPAPENKPVLSPLPSVQEQGFLPTPGPLFSEAAETSLTAIAATEPQKRHRRTKAEMGAAKAQPDPNAQAPFRPQAANGPAFGMAPGTPIPDGLNQDLDSLFGPAPGK